jgi:hypothetical protein
MLHALFRIIARMPAWLRPAVAGALVVLVLTAGRVLLALPTFIHRREALSDALKLAVAAPALGAVAGLAYSFVGRPLRRVPAIGPYLAGLVTVGAYLGAMAGLAIAWGEEADEAFWVAFGVCAVIFGLVLGHQLFREEAVPPAA